jgi:hypothetical protein
MIAAIAGFLARRQTARPMAGCGSERTVVGRTPAAIAVQVPAVSIGRMEGAGTTLTPRERRGEVWARWLAEGRCQSGAEIARACGLSRETVSAALRKPAGQ